MVYKLTDYIAKLLVENGITNVFTVVGGGAMHLNDSFGQCEGINCIYNHHEQACAIAAEGFARINGKIAVACVTTGPGGTNALTGVLCAWQDSVPMLVISGQTRYATTVESTGLELRQFGEQEHYIIETVKRMTKLAVMVKNPNEIKYYLQKALYEAKTGRQGPCWIDIPLDVQSAMINEDDLVSFYPPPSEFIYEKEVNLILEEIKNAKAPVLIAGSAIRQTGQLESFYKLAEKLNIPIICPTSICDYFTLYHPLYYGNFGVFGGRAGNFIVQNADLIVSLGARMSFKQIGFNFKNFSPKSKKIVVDIDLAELQKSTMDIDYPINADLKHIIAGINNLLVESLPQKDTWLTYCNRLKNRFEFDEQNYQKSEFVNPYFFANRLLKQIDEENITVVGNSCACVSLLQMGISKSRQRIFGNVNCGTMGYDIPAAIGAATAAKKPVICATGDGSFQMNIQELQTIVHNNIPVKFIVFNNNGYQAIVQSQSNFFNNVLSGCTPESGVSFPSFEKISYAYGIPYHKVNCHEDVDKAIEWLIHQPSYCLLEVIQDTTQPIEPKVMSKKLPDGGIFSPPIDDLSPFLSKEEYDECANLKD